jgi:hypothetical protein
MIVAKVHEMREKRAALSTSIASLPKLRDTVSGVKFRATVTTG